MRPYWSYSHDLSLITMRVVQDICEQLKSFLTYLHGAVQDLTLEILYLMYSLLPSFVIILYSFKLGTDFILILTM
jgi:hypothetical protein